MSRAPRPGKRWASSFTTARTRQLSFSGTRDATHTSARTADIQERAPSRFKFEQGTIPLGVGAEVTGPVRWGVDVKPSCWRWITVTAFAARAAWRYANKLLHEPQF